MLLILACASSTVLTPYPRAQRKFTSFCVAVYISFLLVKKAPDRLGARFPISRACAPLILQAVPVGNCLRVDYLDHTQTAKVSRLVIDRIVLHRSALQQRHREAHAICVFGVNHHAIMRTLG